MRKFLLFTTAVTFILACQSPAQEPAPVITSAGKETTRYRRPPIPDSVLVGLPSQGVSVAQSSWFDYLRHGEIPDEKISAFRNELEVYAQEILSFHKALRPGIAPAPVPNPLIRIHLYPSSEIKWLSLRNADPEGTSDGVDVVLQDMYAGHFPSEPLEPLLRKVLGKPTAEALEQGLAVAFVKNWNKRGHTHWSSRLAAADLIPDLKDLLNLELWTTYSDVIAKSLTASFTDYLREILGQEAFVQVYQHTELDDLLIYEEGWKKWLKGKEQEASHRGRARESTYFKGFNFAHEGYQIYNGYGSRMAAGSLRNLAGLGCNAVAIVPYSFLRNANEAAPIPIARFAGGENDEAVFTSCHDAKSIGLYTLLKPQIWMGHGLWPGDIEMTNEQSWAAFFRHYTYWIAHYALLAEVQELDALCIGTELSKTTLQRPDDWRLLVHRIRQLFDGQLTYAANWGEEFEQLSFWELLDFAGLNCYYPLSQLDNPSGNDLQEGFDRAMQKAAAVAKRTGKQVVLTEVGFASSSQPWKNPHSDNRNMAFDVEAQKRCFETMFRGIEGKPWINGLFIWKYPSYLHPESESRVSFHIVNRPAEALIRQEFARLP